MCRKAHGALLMVNGLADRSNEKTVSSSQESSGRQECRRARFLIGFGQGGDEQGKSPEDA
jgi:hypothetical protein